MAYRTEKNANTGKYEIVIDGFEKGIAPSPHRGLGNIQNVNTSTEQGEIMCSFNRIKQSQTSGSGTLTQVNTNTVSVSGITLLVGTWIHITNAGTTGLSGDYYYVSSGKLSATFAQNNGTIVTGITAGTATFTVYPMGQPLQGTSEIYTASDGTVQYRYYIIDNLGQVWVHDTFTLTGVDTPLWFSLRPPYSLNGRIPGGLAAFNGWLTYTLDDSVYWESTSILGTTSFYARNNIKLSTNKPHYALAGHQGKLYWTDGNFIASVFPNTSTISGGANIQSYARWTAVTTTGTITNLIGGSYPNLATASLRVPVVFYTAGTLPSAITPDLTLSGAFTLSITYYILWLNSGTTFEVYAAATGGSAIDMQTGSVGTQYFNTFSPLSGNAVSITDYVFTPQRLNLPFFETAQAIAEIGNTVIVGGIGNTLYPWDQVSPLPGTIIVLPETNTKNIITVNSVAYVFTGNKGNIYATNGSSASPVLTVPDYCAGIAGTPASYIEPYFSWGGSMFLRGRVYFSILDQTATKTGNCGGVWSFSPADAQFISQDAGLSLRLENQNSYGTYNGTATVLIPSQDQSFIGPQYWSGWYSSISNPTYGIDFTDTVSSVTSIIETDLIPTGTLLDKVTFSNIEYKLASPLASGESVAISYRQNGTDSYTTIDTLQVESATGLSGVFPVNFQNGQWLQLKVVSTSLGSSSSSFVRLNQLRIR